MLCCARVCVFSCALIVGVLPAFLAPAAEPLSAASEDAARQAVDLFAGIEAGSIEARVIPRNEKHVNLLLENKTAGPLTVSIPAALAVVPVMAQFDFPWPGQDQNQNRQQPQNVGAAPPWQGPQGNGGPMNFPGGGQRNFPGGPLFSIPPEDVTRVRLTGVCLDHGLPTPRPKMPYELRPMEQVAARPEVAVICMMLGQGRIDQVTAQLAAWHFQNDLSWDELAALRDKAAIGTVASYTPKQLGLARQAAEEAEKLAEAMQPVESTASTR